MPQADPSREGERWLRFAREDLEQAERMLDEGLLPRHCCWLAQQAAEKAIKSALVFLQVPFGRVHDLDALRHLLPRGWFVKREQSDLAELTQWAVEAQYPGDWPDADEADSQRAVRQARGVFDAICRDLHDRGFPTDQCSRATGRA